MSEIQSNIMNNDLSHNDVNQLKRDVDLLNSEVTSLRIKLNNMQAAYTAIQLENNNKIKKITHDYNSFTNSIINLCDVVKNLQHNFNSITCNCEHQYASIISNNTLLVQQFQNFKQEVKHKTNHLNCQSYMTMKSIIDLQSKVRDLLANNLNAQSDINVQATANNLNAQSDDNVQATANNLNAQSDDNVQATANNLNAQSDINVQATANNVNDQSDDNVQATANNLNAQSDDNVQADDNNVNDQSDVSQKPNKRQHSYRHVKTFSKNGKPVGRPRKAMLDSDDEFLISTGLESRESIIFAKLSKSTKRKKQTKKTNSKNDLICNSVLELEPKIPEHNLICNSVSEPNIKVVLNSNRIFSDDSDDSDDSAYSENVCVKKIKR
jgi:hypothetical protein